MRNLLIAIATIFIPASAMAHSGVVKSSGFLHGLLHFIGGWDHLLVAAGLGLVPIVWAIARFRRSRSSSS